jgi:hypothetical protein
MQRDLENHLFALLSAGTNSNRAQDQQSSNPNPQPNSNTTNDTVTNSAKSEGSVIHSNSGRISTGTLKCESGDHEEQLSNQNNEEHVGFMGTTVKKKSNNTNKVSTPTSLNEEAFAEWECQTCTCLNPLDVEVCIACGLLNERLL